MRNKTTAGILAIFLWAFGAHKFYLWEKGVGVLYLIFCWTNIPRIVGVVEGIMLLKMPESDFNQKYNSGNLSPAKQQKHTPSFSILDSSQISSLDQLEKMREDGKVTIDQYLQLKEKWMNQHYGN